MRKKIRVIVAGTLITIGVANINTYEAYAAWSKNNANKWIYTENGKLVTGWKMVNNIWYHFDNKGIMETGWILESGKWYYLKPSGAMATGWLKDNDGRWYYLNSDGSMYTGWLTYKNDKYYLKENGAMVYGKTTIDKKEYTFSASGALIEETVDNESSLEKDDLGQQRTGYVSTLGSTLNLRKSPSTSAGILAYMPNYAEVTVLGSEVSGFYYISYNNIKGYASKNYITFNKPYTDDESIDNEVLKTPRTTAPDTSNKHYYSDSNIFYKVRLSPPFYSNGNKIVGNCTWYAWGRAWEITGQKPTQANLTGNAYQWYEANKKSGKFKYGSVPKVGAIAVWNSSLPNSGGCGHVAVIEKIENGKIYISESAWHGVLFKYREIYSTEYIMGYIYIDEANY